MSMRLAASFAALTAASALHAQTRVVYVDQSAPAGGDGTSWQRAFRELDVAIQIARESSDSIPAVEFRVAQGTYRPTRGSTFEPAFELGYPNSLSSAFTFSIFGAFGGLQSADPELRDFVRTPTTLSGDVNGDDGPDFVRRDDNRGPVLGNPNWSHSRIVLDGLRIIGGARGVDDQGGGVHLALLSTTRPRGSMTNCIIEDNESGRGAGAYVIADQTLYFPRAFIIADCDIRNNRATTSGGGVYAFGSVLILHCSITGNQAANYGGGYASSQISSTVELARCVIADNHASSGGGLFGFTQAYSSLVVGNRAVVGGGGFLTGGTITSCTFAHNHACYGGGLHLAQFDDTINSSILALNVSDIDGDEISYSETFSPLRLLSVLVQGGPDAIFGPFGGGISDASTIFDFEPGFVSPNGLDGIAATWQDNDYHLGRGSRAIDAGPSSIPDPHPDLDGQTRIQPRAVGGLPRADLGCYEFQPRCPADANQDDGVTTDDLLDFLTAYTLGQPLADIDDGSATNTPDDGVTIDDLLYFLARYNAGC